MLPDRVSNPGPLTYESGALPIALRGPAILGKLPVPGRPTIWMIVGQGPIALAGGAGRVVWTCLLSSILSLRFLPLFGRRLDID